MTALKVRRKRRAWRGPASGERQALIQAIVELPPEARDVFLLHGMAGLRYEEIGLHLNMSPAAVQAHLAEALGLLSRSLAGIEGT